MLALCIRDFYCFSMITGKLEREEQQGYKLHGVRTRRDGDGDGFTFSTPHSIPRFELRTLASDLGFDNRSDTST